MSREEMILANRPMVYWLARKFKADEDSAHLLVEAGMDALFKAVDTYNETDGDFSAFAYSKIRTGMIAASEKLDIHPSMGIQSGDLAVLDSWVIEREEALSLSLKDEAEVIKKYIAEEPVKKNGVFSMISSFIKKVVSGEAIGEREF